MKLKKLFTLLTLFVSMNALAQMQEAERQASATHYDYTEVARSITRGCTTKYDQVKAIYRWICANISYDTSYTIYTADECWDQRKGVCQAYSELFYRLAEPLGIEVRLISGTSKSEDNPSGSHMWIFAIVEGENTGILIDATWGAGSVEGRTFTRSIDDMSWFHVNPYWMIFTHYPDLADYQLLPHPISRQQFDALPIVEPMWAEYGFDAKTLLERCIAGEDDLPSIYESGRGYLRIVDAPLTQELRIGHKYTFAVQKLKQCGFALINKDFYKDWHRQDGTYYLEFVPTTAGEVKLSVQKEKGESYWTVMKYQVPQPTAADLRLLEQYDPLLMPEIRRLQHADISKLKRYGIDGKQLLAAVRAGTVTELPTFYHSEGHCTIEEMPLNGTLHVGQTYTFSIRPHNGLQWAIINVNDWYKSWQTDPDTGAWTMTVTPQKTGKLLLSVQMKEGEGYSACFQYEVR